MPNRQSAQEWLEIARHDLAAASLLYKNDNFELEYLEAATTYYVENRYPNAYQTLPSREEIKEILDFSYLLIKKINNLL